MWKYIIRRLLLLIPVMLGVTIVVFSIMYLVPGDPAVAILGTEAEPEALEALRIKLNLDKPYLVRLGIYLYQVFLRFDLGESYLTGNGVMQDLMMRFPYTLTLDLACIFISLLGIPLGVYAATHQNKTGDYIAIVTSLIGVSIPGFWLALMLVLLFANTLRILPAYGVGGFQFWILPILASSLFGIGMLARQTRSSMLEVINSDYIVMARSKGLSERKVIYKHALPNALIPVITIIGTSFGALLGGNVLTETIFTIPGIGNYMVKAVNNRDYPCVQGSVLMLSLAFSIIMIITDLALAYTDPRIKAQFIHVEKKRGGNHDQ
ncbi:peptide ABC transporter permease [Spirochaetia bacterium]|nr:peptide ABC transporter permease [Spirochaetia bacterium]